MMEDKTKLCDAMRGIAAGERSLVRCGGLGCLTDDCDCWNNHVCSVVKGTLCHIGRTIEIPLDIRYDYRAVHIDAGYVVELRGTETPQEWVTAFPTIYKLQRKLRRDHWNDANEDPFGDR